jgi:hypothetical protein
MNERVFDCSTNYNYALLQDDAHTIAVQQTFDQKYFAQLAQTEDATNLVQDMMLALARLLLRHGILRLFSRVCYTNCTVIFNTSRALFVPFALLF